MDLVLIAGTRGVLPVTQITKDVLERGDYMLALVTSGGGGRDGGVQAKADLARWVRMKETLLTKDRRASAMKAVATKNAKKSASATATAMTKGAEVMSEKRYSDNGRRAAVDMGDADLSMSGKDGLGGVMQGGGKRFRGSAESERVVSNITRVLSTPMPDILMVKDSTPCRHGEPLDLCKERKDTVVRGQAT